MDRSAMRLSVLRHTTAFFLTVSAPLGSRASAQVPNASIGTLRPSAWQAGAGVVAINGLTWAYNRYVQHWHWANVGTRTWWVNIRQGFTWDDDAFMDNQLAHPYHGSLYFNSARASGYDFWHSTPYVLAGSLTWELFTESVRPSLNDLINTTLGGIALGEVTFRLSSLLAGGSGSRAMVFGRALGAFGVSPVARAQGLLRRRSSPGFGQEPVWSWIAVGRQREIGARRGGGEEGFGRVTLQYGSPFQEQAIKPYDAFRFELQINPEATRVITHIAASGLLARVRLNGSGQNPFVLGLFQHYDYDDLPLVRLSSQSLSGAFQYQLPLAARTALEFGMHLECVPLAAVSSEHGLRVRRDYDYGLGGGGRLTVSARHDNHDVVRLDSRLIWLRTLYGADGKHLVLETRVSGSVPIAGPIHVGGDFGITMRQSYYRGDPHVSQQAKQARLFLIWFPSRPTRAENS